jgi:DivIVA domain-containing protein
VAGEIGIERIRAVKFPLGRKGYDPDQVDAFLAEVVDWLETGGGDEARAEIVKREIERIGDQTAGILASAEDTAQQLRGDAEREIAAMLDRAESESKRVRADADTYATTARGEADEYSTNTRADADAYGAKTRAEADAYARETRETVNADAERKQVIADRRAMEVIESAEAKAQRIVNDGTMRRREIETVIADLVKRRDQVIAASNDLGAELQSVAAGHTPKAGSDPFERPAELDPLERGEPVESETESETART